MVVLRILMLYCVYEYRIQFLIKINIESAIPNPRDVFILSNYQLFQRGLETVLENYANALDERGFDVSIVGGFQNNKIFLKHKYYLQDSAW